MNKKVLVKPNIKDFNIEQLKKLNLEIEKELAEREKERVKTLTFIDVVWVDDGSEGFYCPVSKWKKITAKEIKGYITQTLNDGSSISFEMRNMEKTEYENNYKRYEWNFE